MIKSIKIMQQKKIGCRDSQRVQVDTDGRINEWNDKATEITGFTRKESTNRLKVVNVVRGRRSASVLLNDRRVCILDDPRLFSFHIDEGD